MADHLSPDSIAAATVGSPSLLGTIVATTTKNNYDTATPFNNSGDGLKGKVLLIQPDAACYILPVTSSTGTVTTSNGVKLAADEKVTIHMGQRFPGLACLSVSGTTNCKVWELT